MESAQQINLCAARAQAPFRGSPLDRASATAAAAILTYAAHAGRRHAISGIAWSYDEVPAAGAYLQITNGGIVCFYVSITHSGPGQIDVLRRSSPGQTLIITLSTGGAGVRGDVSTLNYWPEGV